MLLTMTFDFGTTTSESSPRVLHFRLFEGFLPIIRMLIDRIDKMHSLSTFLWFLYMQMASAADTTLPRATNRVSMASFALAVGDLGDCDPGRQAYRQVLRLCTVLTFRHPLSPKYLPSLVNALGM